MGRQRIMASSGILVDHSGSITAGGTAQAVASPRVDRHYLLLQNKTTGAESFWVNFDVTAVADSPSIEVAPGVTLTFEASFCPNGAISVIAATTGTKYTIKDL